MKKYFDASFPSKRAGRSRRMRGLMARLSTEKIFVGAPEIKQNTDAVNVTIYTFDRQKQSFLRKVYYYKRLLKMKNAFSYKRFYGLYTKELLSGLPKVVSNGTKLKRNCLRLFSRHVRKPGKRLLKPMFSKTGLFSKRSLLNRNKLGTSKKETSVQVPFSNSGMELHNEIILHNIRLFTSLKEKKSMYKSLFTFYFVKWALNRFGVVINILRWEKHNVHLSMRGSTFFTYKKILTDSTFSRKYESIANLTISKSNKLRLLNNLVITKINFVLIELLLSVIREALVNKPGQATKALSVLFKHFNARYYRRFLRRYLKRDLLAKSHYDKLKLNIMTKFKQYLPRLKHQLDMLYNKKVSLNLVKLNYPFLKSDIYADTVARKLKKMHSKPKRVLGASLKMISLFKADKTDQHLLKRWLKMRYTVQRALYKKKAFNQVHISILNVLDSIKYKWVTGVRLEGKGRLTKRYTASRSLYIYRYKGNLRNNDYKYNRAAEIDYANNTISPAMLRNTGKPNIQYTLARSKRRVGAFGLRGWISSS